MTKQEETAARLSIRQDAYIVKHYVDLIDPPTSWAATVVAAEHIRLANDRILHQAVELARAEGFTWAAIGARLGISRQAAQQRFRTIH